MPTYWSEFINRFRLLKTEDFFRLHPCNRPRSHGQGPNRRKAPSQEKPDFGPVDVRVQSVFRQAWLADNELIAVSFPSSSSHIACRTPRSTTLCRETSSYLSGRLDLTWRQSQLHLLCRSMLNTAKNMEILFPAGVTILTTQLALCGYLPGQPGLTIRPLVAVSNLLHATRRIQAQNSYAPLHPIPLPPLLATFSFRSIGLFFQNHRRKPSRD